MTKHATGSFEIKLIPQEQDNEYSIPNLNRMAIDKTFEGDLEATSKGQMLAIQTGTEGSAGYVAIELVTGTLQGRNGTFVLQHSGAMARGDQQLTITVVPDSGTDQLTGLSGNMQIKISQGQHFYEFDYSLPDL